jgi:predicted Holliday junction resolvase-like endonuclease
MSNLLNVFQSFRRVLCICPCCGELLRLSDLHLKYSGKAPKTWLDTYESQLLSLEEQEVIFAEKEQKIREKSIERGRKKVPLLVKKCLCPEFRKLDYNPYDFKAIMHPVEFIVFDGLENKDLKNVTFLSRRTSDKEQAGILKSIGKTLDNGDYEWKVSRITMDGKVKFE